MNHYFTPTLVYHIELLRQEVSKKNHHEIANIKFCSPYNTYLDQLQLDQCFQKAQSKPKVDNTKSENNGPWDTIHNHMGYSHGKAM